MNTFQLRLTSLVANKIVREPGLAETLDTCFKFFRFGNVRLGKIVFNFDYALTLGAIGQFDFDVVFFSLRSDS